jgi:hypothetical protein
MSARRSSRYYEEFYKITSEFDMLHSSDVESLILTMLGFEVDPGDLTLMVKKRMEDSLESYSENMYSEETFLSFELFASLICDLLQRQKLNRESRLSSLQPDQNSPLSKSKQVEIIRPPPPAVTISKYLAILFPYRECPCLLRHILAAPAPMAESLPATRKRLAHLLAPCG